MVRKNLEVFNILTVGFINSSLIKALENIEKDVELKKIFNNQNVDGKPVSAMTIRTSQQNIALGRQNEFSRECLSSFSTTHVLCYS